MAATKVHAAHLCNHIDDAYTQEWYDAIVANDAEKINSILIKAAGSASESGYKYGHFTFGNRLLQSEVGVEDSANMRLPLAIAAVSGATDSIKALLQAGVCPLQVDCHGNNVVHSMVAFLHYHSDMEEMMIERFQLLVDAVSEENMKLILHHENKSGLRPIEFAAQHGQGSMVLTMFNTPGVYLTKTDLVGLTCYKWIDITDYEGFGEDNRNKKSPLLLMTNADKKAFDNCTYREALQSPLITSWFHKKFSLSLPLIIIWGFVRFFFVGSFMLIDLDITSSSQEANYTGCAPDSTVGLSLHMRIALATFMMLIGLISVLIDIIEIVRVFRKEGKPLSHMLSGRKVLLLQYGLYRACQGSLGFMFLVFTPMIFTGIPKDLVFSFGFARILSPFCAVWSCMYFIQLLPSIGSFISTIYFMMTDLVKLTVVYIIMIMPFVQSFYNFINVNSLDGCIKGFTSLFEVFYSLFMMMLNMVDLTEHRIKNVAMLHLTHMLYTFVVSIMLINFFIAVMTDSVANASTRNKVLQQIQRGWAAYTVENRTKWLLKQYYECMVRRNFVCEGEKVFLIDARSYFCTSKDGINANSGNVKSKDGNDANTGDVDTISI